MAGAFGRIGAFDNRDFLAIEKILKTAHDEDLRRAKIIAKDCGCPCFSCFSSVHHYFSGV